jgi:hypothetical protein
LIVLSDTYSIGTVVPGLISCNTLLIGGVNIDTKIANATSSTITQADLNTKQNTLTSSTNILTKRIDVSDKIVITGTQPTLYLKDINNRSGFIHMNSNIMYFLSGGDNTETWTQTGGRWPLQLHTTSNYAEFGGNIYSPGQINCTILRISMVNDLYWEIQDHSDENLGFYQNRVLKGFIEDDGGTRENRMNFTGQHRCFIKDIPY